jgi:hypothetical protein
MGVTAQAYLSSLDEKYRDIILQVCLLLLSSISRYSGAQCLEREGRLDEAAALCDMLGDKAYALRLRLQTDNAKEALVSYNGSTTVSRLSVGIHRKETRSQDLIEALGSSKITDILFVALIAIRSNTYFSRPVISAAVRSVLSEREQAFDR